MSINLLQQSTSRPAHWIRQAGTRLNQVISFINQFRSRKVVTGDFTIDEYHHYLGLQGGYTITLAKPTDGRRLTIKDEVGGAGTTAITIVGTIDGATNLTINTNYGSVTLIADGTNWFTI